MERKDMEYEEQRMKEEKSFNKVYLPCGGLEEELNLEEEGELAYANWN
jgi:hypothetical protein